MGGMGSTKGGGRTSSDKRDGLSGSSGKAKVNEERGNVVNTGDGKNSTGDVVGYGDIEELSGLGDSDLGRYYDPDYKGSSSFASGDTSDKGSGQLSSAKNNENTIGSNVADKMKFKSLKSTDKLSGGSGVSMAPGVKGETLGGGGLMDKSKSELNNKKSSNSLAGETNDAEESKETDENSIGGLVEADRESIDKQEKKEAEQYKKSIAKSVYPYGNLSVNDKNALTSLGVDFNKQPDKQKTKQAKQAAFKFSEKAYGKGKNYIEKAYAMIEDYAVAEPDKPYKGGHHENQPEISNPNNMAYGKISFNPDTMLSAGNPQIHGVHQNNLGTYNPQKSSALAEVGQTINQETWQDRFALATTPPKDQKWYEHPLFDGPRSTAKALLGVVQLGANIVDVFGLDTAKYISEAIDKLDIPENASEGRKIFGAINEGISSALTFGGLLNKSINAASNIDKTSKTARAVNVGKYVFDKVQDPANEGLKKYNQLEGKIGKDEAAIEGAKRFAENMLLEVFGLSSDLLKKTDVDKARSEILKYYESGVKSLGGKEINE